MKKAFITGTGQDGSYLSNSYYQKVMRSMEPLEGLHHLIRGE